MDDGANSEECDKVLGDGSVFGGMSQLVAGVDMADDGESRRTKSFPMNGSKFETGEKPMVKSVDESLHKAHSER